MPEFLHNNRFYYTPIEFALKHLGGMWKMPILWRLKDKVMRYGELKKDIPHITDKMLKWAVPGYYLFLPLIANQYFIAITIFLFVIVTYKKHDWEKIEIEACGKITWPIWIYQRCNFELPLLYLYSIFIRGTSTAITTSTFFQKFASTSITTSILVKSFASTSISTSIQKFWKICLYLYH